MAKISKQFKKFAASGKLKDQIKSRRQHQQIKRKTEDRNARRQKQRGAPREDGGVADKDGEEEVDGAREVKRAGGRAGGVAKTVDELFGAGGMEDGFEDGSELEELSDDDEENTGGTEESEENGEEGEAEELDEVAMKKAMKDLEKKDPEFFKYLKENDRDLLSFGNEGKGKGKREAEVEDDEDEEMDPAEDDEDEDEVEIERRKTSVTMKMLRQWQEGMLKQHSLRSLRKTLLAFRAAAHMSEDDADQGTGRDTKYSIDSAQIFNKLVVTALKFTPVVIAHHLPFKALPDGRVKLQQPKQPNQSLNRLVLSHFTTVLHLIKLLPSTPSSVSSEDDAGGMLLVAVQESTKLLPWVMGARKHLRAYLKVLLDLWSSAGDNFRIAAFLAVRKLSVAGDEAIKDLCLRNVYRALLPPLRNTSPHTLPSLNLMKNTASELYLLAPDRSYPHAFTFIRMLAVHLRNVVRSSTSGKAGGNQEAFRTVYNWQFVHCIDFWSQVLGAAADVEVQRENAGVDSPLKPLIYPLTQIALGVVRLLPSSRYFPLRFHILHSLIRLISRTATYIPLSPFLLEILDSTEFRRSNPKKSTLKPLDLEYLIRAPAAYSKTRVYQECLGGELIFLLGEYHTTISTSIAFPEMVLPVIVTLKRHLKKGTAGSQKVQAGLKTLMEKLEATRTWIEGKRRNVSFAPRDRGEVSRFCEGVGVETTPIGGWMRIQKKVREGKRREVERALRQEGVGEDEE